MAAEFFLEARAGDLLVFAELFIELFARQGLCARTPTSLMISYGRP